MSHFAVAVISDKGYDIEELLLPYMENCCGTPPYEYMEFYKDEDCEVDEITGEKGFWQNPNAKWDYWCEGGRFEKYAIETIGFVSGRVCDIKFDKEKEAKAAEKWWNDNIDENGNAKTFIAALERNGLDRDKYIESKSHVSFRAVVTPDGEWHEVGTMGWFGMSSETEDELYDWNINFEERFIKPYEDYTITIVDCHI